ncbi:MAG: hypothetical protein U5L73_11405 [Rhodoferax sp.]|uniref:hypothetical protein n=1 Tax=Rhodoferax sp. TaxID=50421 RepID=UPI002ACD8788|nr:hypothetical protein [Rhodoferax sp.]MDZ7892349.1 hypothetical protein [Rhodoferax sp.]
MIVISIDPGLTGACSIIDHNGLRAVFDLPTMPIPGVGPAALVKCKLDGVAFKNLLLKHCPAGESARAVIEAVGTMGGKNNAIQTQGSLLRTLGAIETVLELLGLKPTYAHPQTWKRYFGLIESSTFGPKATPTQMKAKSLATARRLYPHCTEFKRARDHNRAESALLGHWMQKELA